MQINLKVMGKVISKTGEEISGAMAIHPGELLGEELQERGIKQADFALQTGVMRHHISDIIHGRRNITARYAIRLEKALGISADFWLNLQTGYDLAIARQLDTQL